METFDFLSKVWIERFSLGGETNTMTLGEGNESKCLVN